ncbi:MAG: PilW family protein [Nitrospinae bacterium]|nr:PilW family protein [Nitrospinota bacterium]
MRRPERHAPLTRGQAGFTLIELLIVLGIATFIMAGMVGLFRSNRTAFTLLDQMRILEENGRVAADYMSRELRPAKLTSLIALDNADATEYPTAQASLGAKAGTDIIRLFDSVLLIDPIYIQPGDFNANAANVKFMETYMTGFPGYDPAMSQNELSNMLAQYTALIYNCGSSPPHARTTGGGHCTQNITSGGDIGGGDTQIVYNRGVNTDNANRPHDCSGGQDGSVAIDAAASVCISIGHEYYYYVRSDDPGDASAAQTPQLVRYILGSGNHEVVANNVEDMQIEYGLDTDATPDGVIDIWMPGSPDPAVMAPEDILAVRVSYLMVTETDDTDKLAEAPITLSNSTIDTIGVADQKRRRVITRTTRMRNPS